MIKSNGREKKSKLKVEISYLFYLVIFLLNLSFADTEGNASSRNTTKDKDCFCSCARCMCTLISLPTDTPGNASGCGIATYSDLTNSAEGNPCKKRTATEIQQIMIKKNQFNLGLFERAMMLKSPESNGEFTFIVPLKLLHSFFSLSTVYPQKRILSIEMELNPSSKTLITEPDVARPDSYDICLTSIYLDLSYVTFEANFRIKWMNLINESYLIRTYPCEKVTHHTLSKSSFFHYVPNIIPYGPFPSRLLLAFIKEPVHGGNHSNPFIYQHENIKSIQVYMNGVEHNDNPSMRDMDCSDQWGIHTFQWYSRFLKVMHKNAETVSFKRFFSEMYVFAIDLSSNPSHVMKDPITGARKLDLISSGALDIHFQFKSLPETNIVVKVIAFHTGVVKFDASGELIDDKSND